MGYQGLIKAIGALKNHARIGWLIEGIPKSIAEDVAQHTFEASIYALVLSYEMLRTGFKVNVDKALALTIIHDLGEAFVGDVVKFLKDYIGEVKEQAEIKAFKEFIRVDYLLELYKEYVEGKTLEARIARIADMLATYVQAKRYYMQGFKDVERILVNTYNSILKSIERNIELKKPVQKILSSI